MPFVLLGREATSFPGTYLRVFLKFVDIKNRTPFDWRIRDLLLNQVTAFNAFIVVASSLYRLVTVTSLL